MPAAVACLLVLVVALQGGERLRKTDLVRLLSSVTLAPDELAALIRRNCLSFTPSGRDRADFVALGAGPVVLREIDACVRRGGAPRPAPTPARPTPVATPAPLPVPRSPVSGVRTGFVLGVGQHAAVGMRPTLVTDTNGHVEVDLTLGPRVGPVQVSATVGAIERQATLYAEPGPAVQLAVRCGDAMLGARVAFAPRGVVVLRVSAQDGFANAAPVTGLQAAPGDRGVLRIAFVGTDASGTLVRVEPRDEGSTSLVIVASGQRRDLSVTVAKQPPPGIALCP
ncbi:MAG: hypothetical protein DMD57_07775 [Gemmatimonadetes bacterium]|nr:MAG: hypothetical protein DMD57_07775 [Gemmatimonadota bacterium]